MRILLLSAATLLLTSCQLTYLIKSGYHQAKILGRRVPLDDALAQPHLSAEMKDKIKLTKEVRAFIQSKLKLKLGSNYTSYVQLDQPYVTYALSGAHAFELKPYEWNYPLVGRLPYRGHFTKEDAEDDERDLSGQGYDTFVRGVTAYSTLGWLSDPLLSSMLRYQNGSLVNVVIHETVHANLFIKGEADFNERLATFIGNIGTEMFYLEREGSSSSELQRIRDSAHDDKLFSEFLSAELESLRTWYEQNKGNITIDTKAARLKEIQTRFEKTVWPKMKTKDYAFFMGEKLNNARLLSFKTYFYDLSDFEKIYESMGRDFQKFFEFCKSLEDAGDPEEALKARSPS
ncbi:MAG TPA: aminopeptidase [Bdellovibrionales bacterium]|nr:aminopeptidase [Bdellovibrionales bacterium]